MVLNLIFIKYSIYLTDLVLSTVGRTDGHNVHHVTTLMTLVLPGKGIDY